MVDGRTIWPFCSFLSSKRTDHLTNDRINGRTHRLKCVVRLVQQESSGSPAFLPVCHQPTESRIEPPQGFSQSAGARSKVPPMVEKTTNLDDHRGMMAQRATELRRLRAEVEADQAALRARQQELETLLAAAPASNW